MASSACCDAGRPVTHDYTPKGAFDTVEGMKIYRSGSGDMGVVVIYDIFGFNFNQVLQVCDRLAAAGCNVAAPDTFRGKPWSMHNFPPKPEDDFMGWIQREGSFAKVSQDIDKAVALLNADGAKSLGILGFCWGASIAVQAAADPTFKAAAGAHPTFFGQDKALAERVQCPLILLPAKGDPMELVKEVLDTREFGSRCVYRRFDAQAHGFCAARGDWGQPEVAAAATEAIGLMADFLQKNL